jgi:urease accessory protein
MMLSLLLADGRTPTGGFAHSGGLEAAGLAPAAVPAFMAARLRTAGLLDAAVAARVAGGDDPLALEAAWAARTPAPAARDAARRLGRALLRLALALWPGELEAYAAASAATPRCVVLGLAGRAAGMAPAAVAELSLYDDAAAVAAAVPKLGAVDALEAAAWLAGMAPLVAELVPRAVRDGALPASATPLLDLRAQAHHDNPRRLFVS